MPTYEYQCTACQHQMEAFQKMSDEPLKECPVCHESGLKRLVSAAGFQLKGGGWYVTDYSNKGKAKSAETKTEGTEKTTSTETKTETSSGSKSTDSSSNNS